MKPKPTNKRYRFTLFGRFNWRTDFASGNQYHRFESEEEFLASLSDKHRQVYLEKRKGREKKWYASRNYQRHLRLTRKILKAEEKAKKDLLLKRFKNVKFNEVLVPAEVVANIALLCYENGLHK